MYKSLVSVLVFACAEIAAYQYPENYRVRNERVRHEAQNRNGSGDRRPFDFDQLEHRLRGLETQISEKSENLRSEIRQNNYRLQTLERQSSSIQTALEAFRRELATITENNHTSASGVSNELELKIDNLQKGLQLVVAALRGMNTNIAVMKRNISAIAQNTKDLILNQDSFSPTPSFTTTTLDKHKPSLTPPKNCQDLLNRGTNTSGVYLIQPSTAPNPFLALCDMETSGGGWTFIHNRYAGLQDFYLNWSSYKLGFGNLAGEFWLGLEYLHHLTGYEVNELLVELVDLDGNHVYAHYGAFSVGSEEEGYSLKVLGGYSGAAQDSLIYHAGSKFSTKDKDQDEWGEGSCAQAHSGAWWYKTCDTSNLNGRYLKGNVPEDYIYRGMYWGGFHGPQYSLQRARLMVRPRAATDNLVASSSTSEEEVTSY